MTTPERDVIPPVPEDWSRALAVVAHPDDLEYGISSAIARWTEQGKEITYVLVTDGEAGIDSMPPHEAGPLRRKEQIESAQAVGVHQVEFLGFPDGLLEQTVELRAALARSIRHFRPEVLISLNFRESFQFPGWNHVDHRNIGPPLLDASRDAGNRWIFTSQFEGDDAVAPWSGVRFAIFGNSPNTTHITDVSNHIQFGVASLEAHRVYLDSLPEGTRGKNPDEFLRGGAARVGQLIGVDYAVGFELIPL